MFNEATFRDEMIRERIEKRRELQQMYKHAADRSWEIRTKALPAEKEPVRKKILARYSVEKKVLNEQINELGDEIWRLQHEEEVANDE